jgi:hypothetical protein
MACVAARRPGATRYGDHALGNDDATDDERSSALLTCLLYAAMRFFARQGKEGEEAVVKSPIASTSATREQKGKKASV